MLAGRRITVLGAGIGGLAAALALARRGARVRVVEQARVLDGAVGAGLQISPNGAAVLDALGLGEGLREVGLASGAVELRDGPSGRRVLAMDLGGRDYFLLHRGDLVALLERAVRAAGVELQLGTRVDAIRESVHGVALGEVGATPLLVGADGQRSVVRELLNGAGAPPFTGQTAYRALVPVGRVPRAARAEVWMGPGRHLVRYPVRGGQWINLVGVVEQSAWQAEGWAQRADPAAFAAAFAGFAPEVRAELARVGEVNLWGLFRHEVARVWHSAHMVLLGDAAHPTLPFLAQGANLALEDAWVLAECLDTHPRAEALARYEGARRARVTRAIESANANARNYHLSNPLARRIAHLGLRAIGRMAPGAMLRRFDWLYGHDVTGGAGRRDRSRLGEG